MRLFNVFGSLKGDYLGSSITFHELIQKIRTPNEWVEEARRLGKGTPGYSTIKTEKIESFFPNAYTTTNSRSPRVNKYKETTGHIYLDFDGFENEGEAQQFKQKIIQQPFIAACWLSLSGRGLSALVRVKNCNSYQYGYYWDKLDELFDGTVDRQTRDYHRSCCVSYDQSVYVNPNCVDFDSIYDFSYKALRFRTEIPEEEFQGQAYIVYPDGKEVWGINLFKYLAYYDKHNNFINRRIKDGNRTKTLGYISMVLIHLNPDAPKELLVNTLQSINRKYCDPPLPSNEVTKLFESNYKKHKEGKLDVSKYAEKQHIFFNKKVAITRSERMSIINKETNKLKGRSPEQTMKKIEDCVFSLMDGQKITQKRIAQVVGLSLATIKRYYAPVQAIVREYNRNRRKGITSTYTSYKVGDNNVITDTFLNHDLMPSEEQVPPHSSANIVISDTFLTQSFK